MCVCVLEGRCKLKYIYKYLAQNKFFYYYFHSEMSHLQKKKKSTKMFVLQSI